MLRSRSAPATVMLAAIAVLLAPAAEATNGYFTHGYGTSNKGLAGAGVAFPQDALTLDDLVSHADRRFQKGADVKSELTVVRKEASA